MLGWDVQGRAVFYRDVEQMIGMWTRRVAIIATHPDGETVTTLLSDSEYAAGSHYPKGGLKAARQRTLDDLGPLVPSQRQVALKTLVGQIAGEKVSIHIGCYGGRIEVTGQCSVALFASAPNGAWLVLKNLESLLENTFGRKKFAPVHIAPDGRTALLTMVWEDPNSCWGDDYASHDVFDIPTLRARLANAIGFREYKKGHLIAAHGAFVEAIVHNPTFGIAHFNRAGIESLLGEHDMALASLREAVAIEARLQKRACRDKDFDALHAT